MQRMARATGTTPSNAVQPFEVEAQQVIGRIRTAFAAILNSLPGRVARAHEVSKAFGVHEKLGWQIANLVYMPDLFAAAHHIPGATSLHRFFTVAARRRVPGELIDSAKAAMEEFDRLIDTHAGDRESLNMMLTACASDGAEKAHIAQRQAMFMGGSHIWGVQVQVHAAAYIVQPAEQEDRFDAVRLRGFKDFRRTRPNVPWVVSRSKTATDGWKEVGTDVREPLDPSTDAACGVPLLRQFCSQPLPRFHRRQGATGFLEDVLLDGPIGNTGAMTFYSGEVTRSVASRYRAPDNEFAEYAVQLRTPVALLVFDQFIHEDLFGPVAPKLHVYSELAGADIHADGDHLQVFETVTHLGKGIQVARTPALPQYHDVVQYAFDRLGWEAERFDVYRVQMQYPAIPTSVTVRHPMPEAPA